MLYKSMTYKGWHDSIMYICVSLANLGLQFNQQTMRLVTMQYYETIHTEDVNGFHIMCSVTHEDTHPRDLFDDSIDDINEICRKIDNGTYVWFIARVEAFKGGILLGTSYIGGNLYENVKDFIHDGMYEDMMHEAITEAKKNLEMLYTTRDEVTL